MNYKKYNLYTRNYVLYLFIFFPILNVYSQLKEV